MNLKLVGSCVKHKWQELSVNVTYVRSCRLMTCSSSLNAQNPGGCRTGLSGPVAQCVEKSAADYLQKNNQPGAHPLFHCISPTSWPQIKLRIGRWTDLTYSNTFHTRGWQFYGWIPQCMWHFSGGNQCFRCNYPPVTQPLRYAARDWNLIIKPNCCASNGICLTQIHEELAKLVPRLY